MKVDPDGNLPSWAKIAIGVAAIAIGITATVATGGAFLPALLGSLELALGSTVSGAVIGGIIGGISFGSLSGALHGAKEGALDGFMTGGITAGAMQGIRALFDFAGEGIRLGKNTEALYRTPSTKGGTFFSTKTKGNYRFRVELDSLHGFHFHAGKTSKIAKIHRVLIPWIFGKFK